MSILNVNKINPVGGGSTITIAGIASVTNNISVGNSVTASSFVGSGANLTNIPAGNLTGTVADARISTLTASKLSGALPAISGANLTGLSAGLFSSYAIIADRKSNTTNGGGSGGPNAWFVRNLNTEITDPDGIVSISSNQFTLAAATYLIKWRCPGSRCKTFMTALYNVTDSSYTEYGQTGYSDLSDGSNDYSNGQSRVTISGTKAFEIRMIVEDNDSNAATALGRATASSLSNFSGNETYTVVEIYKES